MQIQEILAIAKRCIDPPKPGKGKSIAIAALLAGLFGPIGVAVYLRSLAQFGWCVIGGMVLSWLTGWQEEVTLVVAAAVWGPARVWLDNRVPSAASANVDGQSDVSASAAVGTVVST